MKTVQELIAAIQMLNQRVVKLEEKHASHDQAIKAFFNHMDDLFARIATLESSVELEDGGVVEVDA